jgi:hypothetical protein
MGKHRRYSKQQAKDCLLGCIKSDLSVFKFAEGRATTTVHYRTLTGWMGREIKVQPPAPNDIFKLDTTQSGKIKAMKLKKDRNWPQRSLSDSA